MDHSVSSSIFSFGFQGEAQSLSESRAELDQQLAAATSTVAILQTEKAKLQSEVQDSKKEQDDLLMLLADQDQKIHSLKQKLKDLGETVDSQGSRVPPGLWTPVLPHCGEGRFHRDGQIQAYKILKLHFNNFKSEILFITALKSNNYIRIRLLLNIHYCSKVWGHPDNFVSSMKTHFYSSN